MYGEKKTHRIYVEYLKNVAYEQIIYKYILFFIFFSPLPQVKNLDIFEIMQILKSHKL